MTETEQAPEQGGHDSGQRKALRDQRRKGAAMLSLVVGVVVLVIKAIAYLKTGSAAIFSDFLESIVHVVATGMVWYAMRVALQPPDEEHPYGHGKAEYFSVGFEGALIFMAGGGIIWHTIERFFSPIALDRLDFGMALIGIVAVINLVLGLYLKRVGRKTDSPLLIGDAEHVLSDVWTTGGIFIGILLVWLTGWLWVDQAIAIVVAIFLMWTAFKMMRSSMNGLMDHADTRSVKQVVKILNDLRRDEWKDVHNLRIRRLGERIYIEFHLSVPGEWTVLHGHDVMDEIEATIMTHFDKPGAVLIHLDCISGNEPDSSGGFTIKQAVRRKPGTFDR